MENIYYNSFDDQQRQLENIYKTWRWIGMKQILKHKDYKRLSKFIGFYGRLMKEFDCEDCKE